MLSFAGLGSLLATLTVASIGNLSRKGLVQLVALGGIGVALVLFSQAPVLPLALGALVLVGALQMTYLTINQTVLQTSITDEVRGRVMSLYMLDAGLVPLGSFAAGAVAAVIGAPVTITGMGTIIVIVAALAGIRVKALRTL